MLGQRVAEAADHDFFRWFHLTRYEAARRLADGTTWHGFRPDGAKFRALVTVNLETDVEDRIADAKLCLDRAFVEHPKDGPFARDITASFLRWAVPGPVQGSDALADFLRDMGDLGPNVIRLAGTAPPPRPQGATSALSAVYLGERKDAELLLTGVWVRLVNLQAREGLRDPQHDWIWIRVSRPPRSD
jgi:hypothetical protein